MTSAMEFLYGDSTPSPLTSNFLEFLRDAIDFGVFALHVDDQIAAIHERSRADSQAAEEEIDRLEGLGGAVASAIDQAPKGSAESATARCGTQLAAASVEMTAAAITAVREKLEVRRGEISAEEDAQRSACLKALEGLLLAHSPPASSVTVLVQRGPDRSYSAWRLGETQYGLEWRIDLGVPPGHAFARETPMERVAPHVEIHAPEHGGWLKKGVKLKAQRLDRLVLTEVSDDGRTVNLKLRTDATGAVGLDLDVDPTAGSVSAMRAGASDDPSAGAFELPSEDVLALVGVAERVRAALAELPAARLAEATLGDVDVKHERHFARLVEQLVAAMAPIVQEVARHSLTSTELVLRRLLTKERREEIFVAKATLREKFMSLRPELRTIFGRLGLDTLPPPRPSSIPATPEENDWPPARAELPRSDPPPPLKPSRPPSA
jgi:hypothetical protein